MWNEYLDLNRSTDDYRGSHTDGSFLSSDDRERIRMF